MTASRHVEPLALSVLKQRYPRLFRKYTLLSDREQEVAADFLLGDDDDDDRHAVDAATGLRTFISFTDFAALLECNGDDCAMSADSDANRFFSFLWRMLDASETGSADVDAACQFDIMNEALDDVLALATTIRDLPFASARFEHLLGWTAAAVHHGLDAMLSRGDVDRNQSLFRTAGDGWKRSFEMTVSATTSGVNEELRKFAVQMCETLQTMLKRARIKYTFNFIKKLRLQQGSANMAKHTFAIAAASSSSYTSSHVVGGLANRKTVTSTITKPSKEAKLGLGIAQEKGARNIKITSISPNGLFVKTDLRVGMLLITINGKKYSSFAEGLALLRAANDRVTIVAATVPTIPAVVRAAASASSASTPVGWGNGRKEDSAPAKSSASDADDRSSVTENGTCWEPSNSLEEEESKKSGAKRKMTGDGDNSMKKPKDGSPSKRNAIHFASKATIPSKI